MPQPRRSRRISTAYTAPLSSVARKNLVYRSKLYTGTALIMALFFVAVGSVMTTPNGDKPAYNQTGESTELPVEEPEDTRPAGLPEVATENGASVEVHLNSESTSSNDTAGSSNVHLEVNGRDITVPENGQLHETVPDASGQGNVQINVQSNSSHSVDNEESTRIRIDADSETEIEMRSSSP